MKRLVESVIFKMASMTVVVANIACQRSETSTIESPTPAASSPAKTTEVDNLAFVLRGERSATTSFILLHGYGAMGTDLIPLADQLARTQKLRFVVAVAPLSQGRGRKWFSLGNDLERKSADAKLSELIDAERQRGAERILVGGFSQGAMMASHAGALNKVDGLVLFSGASSPLIATGNWLKDLPVFVSHGSQDQVLPFEKGQTLRDDLKKAGARVDFFEFSGGHTIGPAYPKALTFLEKLKPN